MFILRLFTFVSLMLLVNKAYATTSFRVSPDDSSTSIVNRTAALLLIEEGKNLFFEGKFRPALSKFQDASKKDKYGYQSFFWIGKCYLEMHNYRYAKQYAEQAAVANRDNDDVRLLLAESMHHLSEVDTALIIYEDLAKSLSKQRLKDLRINECIASCKMVQEARDRGEGNLRKNFPESINSVYNDYAPILIHGGKTLYFTSRRENTFGGRTNPDDNQYFEDNYVAVWNDQIKDWDSLSNKMDRVNTVGFDCISYISPDGLKALMTVNNTAVASEDVTGGSDIFEISFSDKGKWQTPKAIKNKSINTSFFEGSATMTADGNTMFFVSDRNGDKSMTDIYMVQRSGKKWGEAVPVSDSINTPFRETTPYISPDGRFLFFSSDGHSGFGGYDVFVSENLGKTWSKPVNLGMSINTTNDDTHFQYYPKLMKAVMAGYTIEEEFGHIDIFEIDLKTARIPIKN